MTRKEKLDALEVLCSNHVTCEGCHLDHKIKDCRFWELTDAEIETAYSIAFPTEEKPHIKDSGERREFSTGAVRDIQEGKGRCDLLPLDVVAGIYGAKSPNIGRGHVMSAIAEFVNTGDHLFLGDALEYFMLDDSPFGDSNWATIFLEVAKHFEEGAKKYGEYNWQKGIPAHCYIDSAVRHYLKWARGDKDEPHDRAFCWNLLCCMWTCIHKPELCDVPFSHSTEKGGEG